jgi:hypothetical protein
MALFPSAQTGFGSLRYSLCDGPRWRQPENHMLFIVSVVAVMIALVVIRNIRVPRAKAAPLGWMSEQWLAEHRASH